MGAVSKDTPDTPTHNTSDRRAAVTIEQPANSATADRSAAPPISAQEAISPLGADVLTRSVSSPRPERGSGTLRPLDNLDQRLNDVFRIRPQEWTGLERLGIRTFEDILYHLPRDYYDCSNPAPINKLRPGMTTTIIGTLQAVSQRRTPSNRVVVEARIADEIAVLRVSWFARHMAAVLRRRIGERIAVSGHTDLYNGRLQFVPRDYEFPDEDELTHTGRLVPIYPLTEGLTQRWMRGLIRRAVDAALPLVVEPLEQSLRDKYGLCQLQSAVANSHFPADDQARIEAVRRLAFDELLWIGIGMARRKRSLQTGPPAAPIPGNPEMLQRFLRALPFRLTGAQQRALDEILASMAGTVPMNRLLQGDVGCGKTVVAAAALYLAAQAGMQAAVMAPTEVLAEQHARSLRSLLEPFDVYVALLTGAVSGVARRRIYEDVSSGVTAVLVGTHAVIQEEVVFARLGLAIVDEQHRFGVVQRASLRNKGQSPHMLSMTATPIPRTLTLTIYGDLDVSIIDERPPGRQPIETRWVPSEAQAFRLVRDQVSSGRQAYIICPLVDPSETSDSKAAVAEHRRLAEHVFADLRVGLLHGKMRPAEKEVRLAEFRDGRVDLLVTTSVVEVGIDVPNATVMVVREADRFGLSQLHQLRGRVGRGSDRSYCLLLTERASAAGRQRLGAVVSTEDGFELAETDLQLRGPGEFWGTRQSGLPELRVAGLGDVRTIELARRVAEHIVSEDPDLSLPMNRVLSSRVGKFWSRSNEIS